MAISSNALFHLTDSMEKLVGILEKNFLPRYCLENYSCLFHESGEEFTIAFPMTCFCDLPLSQLHEHIEYYGEYGIGLRKEWGIRSKLNPVLYLHQNSEFSQYFDQLLGYIEQGGNNDGEAMEYFLGIMRHIKLYEGEAIKNGKKVLRKFYNEREWRWVPFLTGSGKRDVLSLTEAEFSDGDIRGDADVQAAGRARLAFGPEDIKYIIVSAEEEILPMIHYIEGMRHQYDAEEVRLLTSKIISTAQIQLDF